MRCIFPWVWKRGMFFSVKKRAHPIHSSIVFPLIVWASVKQGRTRLTRLRNELCSDSFQARVAGGPNVNAVQQRWRLLSIASITSPFYFPVLGSSQRYTNLISYVSFQLAWSFHPQGWSFGSFKVITIWLLKLNMTFYKITIKKKRKKNHEKKLQMLYDYCTYI